MTTLTPTIITFDDLTEKAQAAADAEHNERRQREQAEQRQRETERAAQLEATKAAFIQEFRDLWIALAGAAPEIDRDALIHDGKHWLCPFQPGVTLGIGVRRGDNHPQRLLEVHTAHNRSSYHLDSLAALGRILGEVDRAREDRLKQEQVRQAREQQAAEEQRRLETLNRQRDELEAREPAAPSPKTLFGDLLSGIHLSGDNTSRITLCPFRMPVAQAGDRPTGPYWTFEFNREAARQMLAALAVTEGMHHIEACYGRMVVARPGSLLWVLPPEVREFDYSSFEMPGQVLYMSLNAGRFADDLKAALAEWLDYADRWNAWDAERRTLTEQYSTFVN